MRQDLELQATSDQACLSTEGSWQVLLGCVSLGRSGIGRLRMTRCGIETEGGAGVASHVRAGIV